MTSLAPVTSRALVRFHSKEGPLARDKALNHRVQDQFFLQSFSTQREDFRHFHCPTLRERVLSTAYPAPVFTDSLPKPFEGTCRDLVKQVRKTVDDIVERTDYNGLEPYLKISQQLAIGIPFEEVSIDSSNEELATTCVGTSRAIVKHLKEEHGISGSIAALKFDKAKAPFEHAAVVIECQDGFVLIDPRTDPKGPIFSVPFNSTIHFRYIELKASGKGSTTPITYKFDETQEKMDCYTNVARFC